ncbi:MAG TPA: cellulase family glycosylhydrolase [Gemmataceae bacterium]|nr:cellulase family glycosylhydrolase [Gemmataceae bacterium]
MGVAQFRCDCSATATSLPHYWEHTVGSEHATFGLRADWQAQLRRCHEELGFRHVRFHGLLCDDMSTLVLHRQQPLASFFNADQIWDYLLSIGMRPFIELSFMPELLASGKTTVFHYKGNVTPPKSYAGWAGLIRKLVAHFVDRYGVAEVRQWFFEVWNEPNLKEFWTGSQADYFNLYRHTVEAIRSVDGQLQVGGPATAKNEWITEFLDFCDRHQMPADFVSTHQYPNDVLWQENQDTEMQLAHSRRSILREWARDVFHRARGRPVYYTEWNASSNPRFPPQDEPYAAAFAIKTVLEMQGLVECYSFWTFTDLFEENYFPSVPFHGGFGLLNLHGIAKPTYRAFELLHRLGNESLAIEGAHPTVDAWAIRRDSDLTILLTNHALPHHPIETEHVHVQLTGIGCPQTVFAERIDHEHANAKRHWQEMGEPEYLSSKQVEQLQAASQLQRQPYSWNCQDGVLHLDIRLPPHAVAALTIEMPAIPLGPS